jgi:4-hydroxy-3-polyprenylbenzoate decarboxylase
LRAQQAGAVIMPAIVSFYHQPKTIDDLVTQYVCRVLAQIGLPQGKQFTWQGGHGGGGGGGGETKAQSA